MSQGMGIKDDPIIHYNVTTTFQNSRVILQYHIIQSTPPYSNSIQNFHRPTGGAALAPTPFRILSTSTQNRTKIQRIHPQNLHRVGHPSAVSYHPTLTAISVHRVPRLNHCTTGCFECAEQERCTPRLLPCFLGSEDFRELGVGNGESVVVVDEALAVWERLPSLEGAARDGVAVMGVRRVERRGCIVGGWF